MNKTNPLSLDFLLQKPGRAASVLQTLDAEQAALYLANVPIRALAPVIERTETWPAARIIEHMPIDKSCAVLARINYPAAAALMRLVNDKKRKSLLEHLPRQMVSSLNRTLNYPEETVGAWMDSSALHFSRELAVGDCLELLKKSNQECEFVVVVDDKRCIDGVVSLSTLLISDSARVLKDVADHRCQPVAAQTSLAMAKDAPGWLSYNSLPVRANSGVFLGMLSRQALHGAMKNAEPRNSEPLGNSILVHLSKAMLASAAGLLTMIVRDVSNAESAREANNDFVNGK